MHILRNHLSLWALVAMAAPETASAGQSKPQPQPTSQTATAPKPASPPAASPAPTQASPEAPKAPGKPGRPPKDPNAQPAAPKPTTPPSEMGMGALLKAANAAAGKVKAKTAELTEAADALAVLTEEMDKRLK